MGVNDRPSNLGLKTSYRTITEDIITDDAMNN